MSKQNKSGQTGRSGKVLAIAAAILLLAAAALALTHFAGRGKPGHFPGNESAEASNEGQESDFGEESAKESHEDPEVVRAREIDEKAHEILASMTTEQKVSQMLVMAFRTYYGSDGKKVTLTEVPDFIAELVTEYDFGGIILFSENCKGTEQTAREIAAFRAAAADSEKGIPMLIAIDQEGGTVTRLATGTSMPGNMALAATGDTALVREAAGIIGSELSALGFNVDFAPDADVNLNPSNPIIGVRSFSDDPETVSRCVNAFIEGLHEEGIISAIKHFPGHGDTATDSHTGLPCVDKSPEELRAAELVPFAGAADSTDMVMTAHIQFPQLETETYISKKDGKSITLPATLSRTVITGLLREELGFDGVIVTDALNMGAISTHFKAQDTARLAINAGVDMLLMPVTVSSKKDVAELKSYIDGIVKAIENGRISTEEIDDSVLRILKLKLKYNLFDEDGRTADQIAADAKKTVGSEAHHAVEWEIAKRSVTLLKNDGAIPAEIPDDAYILCFVPRENEVNSVRFALNKLKSDGKLPDGAKTEIICYSGKSVSKLKSKIAAASFIVFGAEMTGTASLKTSAATGWQAKFGQALIKEAHGAGKKVIFISQQLPYDTAFYRAADAILCVYNYSGMNAYPKAYDGETTRYGASIPAGFYTALGGCEPTGVLPVTVYELDSKLNYTDKVLYR